MKFILYKNSPEKFTYIPLNKITSIDCVRHLEVDCYWYIIFYMDNDSSKQFTVHEKNYSMLHLWLQHDDDHRIFKVEEVIDKNIGEYESV